MIDHNSVEKIVVAPQIVVYKNLLKNCEKLIEILEKTDKSNSMWPEWEPWYEQGKNVNQLFYRNQFNSNEEDPEEILIEKEILMHISEIYDFIQKDYLSEYDADKGVWPSYIKQWDKVWEKLDPIHINVYKYNKSYFDSMSKDGLMLEYHVDEMPENVHDSMWHQVVTITFYLNDNYTGGEICFYDEGENKAYKYKPKLGDVTVFPSAAPFYHAVEHFSGADRYFMRIFIPYSAAGDEEWLKKNVVYDEAFVKEQEEKINNFVEKYTHAVTLQFPGKKVDRVYGKLVQLNEEINVIE